MYLKIPLITCVTLKEMNETRTRTETEIEEVDGSVRHEYESLLGDALRQMREDTEYTIRTTREETEEGFLSKVSKNT